MYVIIGELSNQFSYYKKAAQTDLKDIQKERLLCVRYFLWTETTKKIFPNQWKIGRKQSQKPKNIGDDEEDGMPFNLLLELFFYDVYGEYLMQGVGLLFDGMTDILTEAMSKKKIKKYMPRESVTERGDAEDKAQLMRAITDTVKSNEIGRQSDKGGYLLSAISCLC